MSTMPVAAVPTGATTTQTDREQSVGARTNRALRVASYVLMGLVVLIYLYPLLFLINTALKSNSEFLVDPTGIVKSPQFGNFLQAWEQGNFAAYVLNSVL